MKFETVNHCYLCGHSRASVIGTLDEFQMMRCDTCTFSFINRRPVEMEADAIYDEYFSGSNADYGKCYEGYIRENKQKRDRKFHFNRFHKMVLKRLAKHAPGKKLLDIGCAAGFFLQDARDAGWEVTGIDIAKPALDFAKKELDLDVSYGRLVDKQYPDNSFDAITMFDLIEHLYTPLNELKEIHRILKPGGVVFIFTPNVSSIKQKILRGKWYAFKPREHNYYFSIKTLSMMLDKKQLKTIHASTGATRLFILPNFRNRLRSKPLLLKMVNGVTKIANLTVGRILFKPFEWLRMGDGIILFAQKPAE